MNGASPTAWPTPPRRWANCFNSNLVMPAKRASSWLLWIPACAGMTKRKQMAFRTLDDLTVKGKRVLVRADLNVPVADGKVTDATRIQRQAPTLRELAEKGAKVI